MRKFIALATLAVLLMSTARSAQAALIVYDSFSGAPGSNLAGTTPTTPNPNTSGANQQWYNDTTFPDNKVVSPGLSFPVSNAPAVSGNARQSHLISRRN